jgi:hypothetical protein
MSLFLIPFHIFQVVPQLGELACTSITHVKHKIKMGIKTLSEWQTLPSYEKFIFPQKFLECGPCLNL